MRLLDRTTSRLPRPWRTIADWLLTIGLAIGFVLTFEAEVAKPYRIPSASMETTLHCAKPSQGCLGSTSDRVIANRSRTASRNRGAARSSSSTHLPRHDEPAAGVKHS